jgi:hypothetical protein
VAGEIILTIRATFRCSVCGQDAETVRFLPKGVESNYTSSDAVLYNFASETLALSREDAAKVREAVVASDAAALFAAHPRFAVTYCPECRACFCRSHWVIEKEPDPDSDWYSMHYDTYATCPSGHKRLTAKDSLSWPKGDEKKSGGRIIIP